LGLTPIILFGIGILGLEEVLVELDNSNEPDESQRFQNLGDLALGSVVGEHYSRYGVDTDVVRTLVDHGDKSVEHPRNVVDQRQSCDDVQVEEKGVLVVFLHNGGGQDLDPEEDERYKKQREEVDVCRLRGCYEADVVL
jgi:hypothetical protein